MLTQWKRIQRSRLFFFLIKDNVDKRNCCLLLQISIVHCPLLAKYHTAVVLTCVAISFLDCVSAELSDPGDVSGSGGSGDWLRPGQRSGGAASQRPWQEALTGGLSLLDGPGDAPRRAVRPQGNIEVLVSAAHSPLSLDTVLCYTDIICFQLPIFDKRLTESELNPKL